MKTLYLTCGAKKRHSTEDLATNHMLTTVDKEERDKFNVYLCPYCHFWHVGHKRGINKGWENEKRLPV